MIVINAIAFRHPGRVDFTEDSRHTLSSETRATLSLVGQRIRILMPVYIQQGNKDHMAEFKVLRRAKELLDVYGVEQPLIEPVTAININGEGVRWKTIAQQYGLAERTQFNRLIFLLGEDGLSRETLMPEDLAELTRHPTNPQAPPILKSFQGEQAITSAISRLVHGVQHKAYFSIGHGEATPGWASGMQQAGRDLESSGFSIETIELDRKLRVPDDCDLLVIIAPEREFSEDELDVIADYLDRDGRLFVALGVGHTKLEGLLRQWGIEVLSGRVRTKLADEARSSLVDTNWVSGRRFHQFHPIMRPFKDGSDFRMRFYEPRPLKAIGASRRLQSTALLTTGESTSAESFYLVDGLGSSRIGADSGESDYVLAVATQQEQIDNPPEDWVALGTRIVVVSSASFLGDNSQPHGFVAGNHRDLIMNSVNWLTDRETFIVADRSGEKARQIKMSDPKLRRFLFFSSIFIFPGIFLCLGTFVYFLRRS